MEEVFPHVVFTFYGIPVRNSVIATWIMMFFIFGGVIALRYLAPVVFEMLIDFISDLASSFISGPPDPYVPFLGSLFIFIAVSNLIGIVPMMYTPTRDINTPLALALVVFVAVFVFSIKAKGIGGFIKGFFSPLLPLDLIGYFSRTMSLTLRLFGNIIGGEIVVAVLFSLVPVGVPLVMVAMGSITGVLQAYVFTALAASYIGTGVES